MSATSSGRVSVIARVQAHPDRADLHGPLVAALGLPTEVLIDRGNMPSPWRGYRACLSSIPDCTHLLIAQDDCVPCLNFAPAVERIAERNLNDVVVLFLGGYPQGTAGRFRQALRRKETYIWMRRAPIIPLVAVLWPKAKAQEFLEWTGSGVTLPGHPTPRADDGIAGMWARDTRQQIRVAVPSLVEHPDLVPSVKGGQRSHWGKDPQRRAVSVAVDGLTYDW